MSNVTIERMNNSGQTSVEYMLMILVVVAILYSLSGKIKEFMLADMNNCTPNSTSLICSFEKMINQENFQYFTLRR